MNKQTIAMPDGRYLIYYTFDDETRQDTAPEAGAEQSEEKKDV